MMKNTVTVICPIRNEEKYIDKCIGSLLNQTYDKAKLEILMVDGMSTDATRDIIRTYMKRLPYIKLIDNPEKNVTSAMNIGIERASGDVIVRIDGHSQIAQDFIEQSVNYLDELEVDCIGGIIESSNDSVKGAAIAMAMSSPFGVGNSYFRTARKEGYVDTVAFGAYRRDVFERFGKIDEELIGADDDEFHYRIRKHGGKIYLTPKIKSNYFSRSSFRELWKQYFGYGYWKIRVMQKHPLMMQPRQFVPSLFLTCILVLAIGGIFYGRLWLFLAFLLSLYLLLACSMSAFAAKRNIAQSGHLLFFAYLVLHFSYGLGFIWGAIKFFPRWFKKVK